MYALDKPGATPEKIADIRLDTDLVTSKFGDERLHFQHVRTKRDKKYWDKATKNAFDDGELEPLMSPKPEEEEHNWDISAWPTNDDDAKDMYLELDKAGECPFAWLLR